MGIIVGFTLRQFSKAFKIRDTNGKPYVLIGGQAVNYWAEHYLAAEPELAKLQPFTSQDIDFKGGRADVQHIADQLHLNPSYPPKVAMTALSGFIPFQIGDLKSSIEVVRHITGIPKQSVTPAIEAEWSGQSIRVLDPISLLASKLELAATVQQKGRQDVAHLRVLLHCVRLFLAELLQEVESGHLAAKDWLKVVNQVLKLTSGKQARKIAAHHQIEWAKILPLPAIASSRSEKIASFREKQLHRG